jgi:hypothetical protein
MAWSAKAMAFACAAAVEAVEIRLSNAWRSIRVSAMYLSNRPRSSWRVGVVIPFGFLQVAELEFRNRTLPASRDANIDWVAEPGQMKVVQG